MGTADTYEYTVKPVRVDLRVNGLDPHWVTIHMWENFIQTCQAESTAVCQSIGADNRLKKRDQNNYYISSSSVFLDTEHNSRNIFLLIGRSFIKQN